MTTPENPVWTNQALIDWTTKYLHSKGIEAPQKEARILLSYVLGCKPIDVVANSQETPNVTERNRFKELIRRRVEGCPTAYLTGTREFYLLAFEVSPAVLIPRPDTEILVMQAIERLVRLQRSRVLDLGTGSGCIAISVAHKLKLCEVVAVDLSPDALEVARKNAVTHGVAERIDFRRADLFQAVQPGERFDLIVSNPPYIAPSEFETLATEVRDHEPRLALDGGPDGLAFYRRIANEAAKFLAPRGTVLVEIGYTQADPVQALFHQAGFTQIQVIKDFAGHPRVVSAAGQA